MKSLFSHQLLAVEKLRTGSILCGGVGSGKTLTAIYYYFTKECEGSLDPIAGLHKMEKPKDLYVITTAKKRDTLDWEHECANFMLSPDRDASINGVKVTVDSWNNINKYIDIENAFFIFDEQRVVGSGAWVKSFYKITKKNNWILLSATPGDTWMDYVPVFIANGFYKNRTAFIREHVVYSNFTKFPKIDHYIEEGKLYKFREKITVIMDYQRPTDRKFENIIVHYDKEVFDVVMKKRWNPYENKPINS
jgi:nitrous oxide reductase accessory protein NosL